MTQKEWTIMIYMAGDNNLAVDMAYAMEQIKGVAERLAAPLCGISLTRRCAGAVRAGQQRCDRCSMTPRPMAAAPRNR